MQRCGKGGGGNKVDSVLYGLLPQRSIVSLSCCLEFVENDPVMGRGGGGWVCFCMLYIHTMFRTVCVFGEINLWKKKEKIESHERVKRDYFIFFFFSLFRSNDSFSPFGMSKASFFCLDVCFVKGHRPGCIRIDFFFFSFPFLSSGYRSAV